MKPFQTKLSAFCLITMLSCIASSVYAVVPTVDATNATENVATNTQSAYQWAEESGLITMAMELEAYYNTVMLEVDAMTQMTTMKKEMKLEEELHNLRIREEHEPDHHVARDCAVQVVGNTVICNSTNLAVAAIDTDQATHANFSDTPVEAATARKEAIDTMLTNCRSLTYDDPTDENDKLSTSMCLRGGILLGTETNSTYSTKEATAAGYMANILAGAAPAHKASESMPEGSVQQSEELNQEVRMLALRSIVFSSFRHLAELRTSASSNDSMQVPSELGILEDFDDERWGDPEWQQKVSMATEDPDDSYSPTQLERINTKMNAFRVHLDLIRYKQQLRVEALQAGLLSLKLDNVSKE